VTVFGVPVNRHTDTPFTLSHQPARWTLLLDPARPGFENMAIDSALLDFAAGEGAAFLRLYQWEPHCLSFGRHEPARRRYDTGRIGALSLDCVRRPTGGRAVWHARELTYAVAAPLAGFGGLRQAYGAIHGLLASALRLLGADPLLAPRSSPTPRVSAGPCFAAPVGGEVLVAGRKVIGSAQLRQGDAFLQHGSLLLEDDQALVRSLADQSASPAAEAPLSRLLGRSVAFPEASAAVIACAEALFGGMEAPVALPARVAAAARHHEERFRSAAWTWQR
jgi:lipoyl(octanoyl) transferase